MSNESNENSEFTPQQRHDIIMKTLSELGKGSQCFTMRWKEGSGDYLSGDILLQTPMFWFMRYKWSRQEIETLFFKAHVIITEQFDRSLQQTFGGQAGARWKGGGGVKKKDRKQQQQSKRQWIEPEYDKNMKGDDTMNYKINHPNFEYNPVDQPVHFEANGGINHNDKPEPETHGFEKHINENNGDCVPNMGHGKTLNDDIAVDESDEKQPVQISSKLNDFLNDICDEIELNDYNSSDDMGPDDFISSFSQSDLDHMRNATTVPLANSNKAAKHKKSAKSITTTVTTGKILQPVDDRKLKRWSGGLNIASKANTIHLLQKSNTLRREKAKLKAIDDAKTSKSSTNVTKLKF